VSCSTSSGASKFAIEGFSESLAQEIASFGIKLTLVEPGAFRTDFLDSRMLKVGTRALDDYREFRTRALAVFEARNHRQIGDPEKLGLAVVKLVAQDEPPLRFAAGADAVQVVEDKLAFVATELSHWRALSISTDF
jgi:NAD(P)-dependent dehydrogenase (short-subunit alcohol dehydrogenase family)